MLLEAYPRVIAYDSLLYVYEQLRTTRDAENPLNSIRVQIAKHRRALRAIGIEILVECNVGFHLRLCGLEPL